jgi:glycosyltransferase involved in cell wall biosynthesis
MVSKAESTAPAGPLVSVVIPVHNRAHLVGRAIGSVLAQTYKNFEIIVVDDASTDDLSTALAALSPSNLHRITHSTNRGAAAARNSGIAAATGEFVALLDSDDAWYPEKLAAQVAAMRDQPPDVVGAVCAYDCVKPGFPARHIVPEWTRLTFRQVQLLGCTCGPGTTLLCRREVYAEIGPYDEKLRRLEDWDWLLRLAEKDYRLLAMPETLAWVDVGVSRSRRQIDAALQRIRQRHETAIAAQGRTARRIFGATLHLEAASAAFGDGAYVQALLETVRALAAHPLRGAEFYRWLGQRLAAAVGLKNARGASGPRMEIS